MTDLPPDLQRQLVREAARAPSVHNVQPARWRFLPGGEVRLFRDVRRALPVADPSGHDVLVSLGAAFEGLALALSLRGLGLSAPEPCDGPEGPFVPIARAWIVDAAAPDPLAGELLRRRAYRGRFRRADAVEIAALRERFAAAPHVTLLFGGEDLGRLARRHDEASYGFLRRPPYAAELYRWMRFRRGTPEWRRDGLNADCMALSAAERWAGAVLLHPRVYPLMKVLGLARSITSEARQIASASALLLFHAPREQPPFEVGRCFHRLWLELSSAGWHACPLSALADDAAANAEIRRAAGLPEERRLVNVLRVGKAPSGAVAESPRLPAEELLI
jgi:nitroreductase